ncbi:mechanosensitive ion channel family protein [Sphingomonas sp.]|uniref:mechanosensitive ion channel family protein n=1 Tax=Sphingomonas sp. TaxID=28214 RepID=UPI002B67AAE7|nr:mechanosensitive ion channel domain-containing protein [Sphingomonas sp.]HWK35814.1 mechanosensitive ion channel domain-containing protein [Sphingomonas sp.]
MSNITAANKAQITPAEVQAHATTLFADGAVWLRTNWLAILIAVGVAAAIWLALHGLRRLGMRLCRNEPGPAGWRTVIGRAIARTGNVFITMTAAQLVTGYADAPPSVATTIHFLFTVAAVFQAAVWAREIILGAVEARTGTDDHAALGTAMGLIRVLVTFALFAIALVVVLDNLGVNVTGLVAGLGVGGIAIGLAAQGIFADLFAALAIIFDRPFRVGETVSYDQTTGSVERIGLKSTRIRATTGEERVISNKNLLDKEIRNITQRSYRRGTFTLSLVYETPAELAERVPAILKELVEAQGLRFNHAGLVNFAPNTLEFEVEFDSRSPLADVLFEKRHKLGIAILGRFAQEGISFADPILAHTPPSPRG